MHTPVLSLVYIPSHWDFSFLLIAVSLCFVTSDIHTDVQTDILYRSFFVHTHEIKFGFFSVRGFCVSMTLHEPDQSPPAGNMPGIVHGTTVWTDYPVVPLILTNSYTSLSRPYPSGILGVV